MNKPEISWTEGISAECIQMMNDMEKIYGKHCWQHDELRKEYKKLLENADYVEKTENGGVILHYTTREKWKAAKLAKEEWWSDIITWTVGND